MRKAGLSFDRYPGLLAASPEIPDEKWGCGIRKNDFFITGAARKLLPVPPSRNRFLLGAGVFYLTSGAGRADNVNVNVWLSHDIAIDCREMFVPDLLARLDGLGDLRGLYDAEETDFGPDRNVFIGSAPSCWAIAVCVSERDGGRRHRCSR